MLITDSYGNCKCNDFLVRIWGHNLYSLLASSIALGFLSAFHHPVRLVFISLVVWSNFAGAVGLNSVSWNVSNIIGPCIAGVTIFMFGAAETFGLATFLFYLLLFLCSFWLCSHANLKPALLEVFWENERWRGRCYRPPLIFQLFALSFLTVFL